MLLHIDRIKTFASDKPPLRVAEAVNPEVIERVREGDDYTSPSTGLAGSCVEILVDAEWIRCLGTVEEVLRCVNVLCLKGSDG